MPSKVYKRILILCEGQTDLQYAKAIKQTLPRKVQRNIEIDIYTFKKKDPKNLVKEARKRKHKAKSEKNEYDEIWLFFDNDNNPNLKNAFSIIFKEGFRFAYSSICIEFWFLLHFEDNRRAFSNCHEVESHLKRYLPQYHKTKINHFEILKDNLDIAKNRARTIRTALGDIVDYPNINPYSSVDELIDFIEELKAEFKDK
jgi:hypothetical protein